MRKIVTGIDIGGTNTVFGAVDAEGRLHGEGRLPTAQYADLDDFIAALAGAIRRLTDKVELAGIGIGVPNANPRAGTIEDPPNLPWRGIVPFVEKFERYFPGIPIRIDNDANAAALGEMTCGAARGMRDFIVVTLGTGVGSGFVSGGRLLSGAHGLAGELGHVTVEPGGRLCGCGRRGCLETYASASGVCRTVFELLAECAEASELRAIAPDELTPLRITEAARRGDALARMAWELTGQRLGRALANAALITDPEAIVLFGGVAGAGELLFDPTRKSLEESLLPHFRGRIKLLPSGVPDAHAAILGAAALIRSEDLSR